MLIDQFTNWIEICPLCCTDVLGALLRHIWVSIKVHTDQGKNFDSNLFKSLCEVLQIAKTRTTPYQPSSNGQVERYNTTVLQMIRCYINKNNKIWDRDLPLLVMALHSTIHRQTGVTPNRIMLGREVIQPVHLLMGDLPDGLHSQEPSDWCFDLSNRLSQAHHHLQEAQLRQKRDYDMRLVEHHYNPGDIVYKLDSTTKVGQSSKLSPPPHPRPWTGPYLVISCNAPFYNNNN